MTVVNALQPPPRTWRHDALTFGAKLALVVAGSMLLQSQGRGAWAETFCSGAFVAWFWMVLRRDVRGEPLPWRTSKFAIWALRIFSFLFVVYVCLNLLPITPTKIAQLVCLLLGVLAVIGVEFVWALSYRLRGAPTPVRYSRPPNRLDKVRDWGR